MRKKRLAIKLLLPFISLLLSSCAANGGRYSYGDRDSFSYTPSHSHIDNQEEYATGKRIFDAFYDPQGYEDNYKNREHTLYLEGFTDLSFTPNTRGLYKVTLEIDGNSTLVDDIGSIYVADINFDGHKDLCFGQRVGSDRDYYTACAYDIYNSKELLNLDERDETYTGGHDYAYNIRDNLLVVESSYNVNPIAINSIGYFKKNTTKTMELDWHIIQFEIIDFEEEILGIRKFKGSDGVERYIVNTEDVYTDLYIYINFIGDFSTSTYKEEDVVFTTSDGYDLTVTNKFIDSLVFSIKFNSEGRYDITCRVKGNYITLHFEANNELYEMLQVAQLHFNIFTAQGGPKKLRK